MAIVAIPVLQEQLFENNRKEFEKYLCPNCNYLLRDPVQQMCCGHWLCECCAKELAEKISPRCPREDCEGLWNNEEQPPVRGLFKILHIATVQFLSSTVFSRPLCTKVARKDFRQVWQC